MIYPFSLQLTGIIVGLLLIASHAFALAAPAATQSFLRAFPRSRSWGGILLLVDTAWALWLVCTIDLGEFARMRTMLSIAVPLGAVLTWMFVDEFLAVRALGILALLAAEPLLEAAFLRPETSRLLLAALAYAWILAGLFLVGMPYLQRDLTAWLTGSRTRYRIGAMGGVVCGAAILGCAIAFW